MLNNRYYFSLSVLGIRTLYGTCVTRKAESDETRILPKWIIAEGSEVLGGLWGNERVAVVKTWETWDENTHEVKCEQYREQRYIHI